MKIFKSSLILVLFVSALASSCSTTNKNEELLIGRWFSIGWVRDGIETDMKAWFEFNDDHTYRSVINQTKSAGKWWVDGYKLYTEATGEERIVVKIEKLDSGNLEIGMNRGGQSELLIFTKAN